MYIFTTTIYVLFIVGAPAGKNPDVGASVDAAACMQSATKLTEDYVKEHPEFIGRELMSCKSVELTAYGKTSPGLGWKKQGPIAQ
jgi:hypothetical protein